MFIFSEEEKLLFTKGIVGSLKYSKLELSGGNKIIQTNFIPSIKDIIEIEKKFNIKLIGKFDEYEEINYLNFPKILTIHNSGIFDIIDYYNYFNNSFELINDYIIKKLYDSYNNFNNLLGSINLAIMDGGINDSIFIGEKDLEKILYNIPQNIKKDINKYIYYYDFHALVNDTYNHLLNIAHRYLSVQIELTKWLKKILNINNSFGKLFIKGIDNEGEVRFQGVFSQKIQFMYMDCIIGLRSVLDLFSKLFFEINKIPNSFDKPIRFKSSNILYENSDRIVELYDNFTNTIFNNRKKYNELSILRNDFVHNNSLGTFQNIFVGKNTDIVNYTDIYYAIVFLRDIEDNGIPSRWNNRSRFYSNRTIIDEYILRWIITIFTDLKNSMNCLLEYFKLNNS